MSRLWERPPTRKRQDRSKVTLTFHATFFNSDFIAEIGFASVDSSHSYLQVRPSNTTASVLCHVHIDTLMSSDRRLGDTKQKERTHMYRIACDYPSTDDSVCICGTSADVLDSIKLVGLDVCSNDNMDSDVQLHTWKHRDLNRRTGR